MRSYYLLLLFLITSSWSGTDSLDTCPIDTNSDSTLTKSDSLHVGRISHHLNSRSSNEGKPYDWFVNLAGMYKYNLGWKPEIRLEGATEREDGVRYNSYLFSHSTDYYFIRDRVDEEHLIYLFETGLHYTWKNTRHGYAYMWWSNTRTERHAIYHRIESDWLNAEIQYLDIIYKSEIELFLDHKWGIGSGNIVATLLASYLNIYNQREVWSLGYKIGYEF